MSDHVAVNVDRLIPSVSVESTAPEPAEVVPDVVARGDGSDHDSVCPSCSRPAAGLDDNRVNESEGEDGEEDPLIQLGECRICQEEDHVSSLETPCACIGSLKYAHRKCVQHWCNEKGDITCEICHQSYQPGYTAPPPPPPQSEEHAIDIGGAWTISGSPLDIRDPRLLAIAEAERHFLESEYDEYASNGSGAAFCRSAALILMALLLMRHALAVTDPDADEDATAFFSIFLLRAVGFLLPFYIMAWAISILQRRRQRQEAAALAATQVAIVLQSGQHRGLQFAIAPGQPVASQQELLV